MISLLLAMDRNHGIGYENDLPWYIPEDLTYFKKVTMGHTIVMGRKTFDSIGKALPGRKNIILTRDKSFKVPANTEVIHSLDELVALNERNREEEFFVIGGAEIFKQILPWTERLYITFIDAVYKADTFFPKVNWDEWNLISSRHGERQEEAGVQYKFSVYEKNKM